VLSIGVSLKPRLPLRGQLNRPSLSIVAAAAALILAGFLRFISQPSFWLDEAFVAVTIRNPSIGKIFARLEYAQFFPRMYLSAIALLRHFTGYRIWSVRLLPFLCFIAGTLVWAHLLRKRSNSLIAISLLGAAMLLGSSYWLDEAIQLKQYTLDVVLALAPFALSDSFLDETLRHDRRALVLLALPCCFSYTYPLALGARLLGWWLWIPAEKRWSFSPRALATFCGALCLALAAVWFTDLRFNMLDRPSYVGYWSDCILLNAFGHGLSAGLRVVVKFLWGWQSRQPLAIAALAPLQIAGFVSVIGQWRTGRAPGGWGSRSLGGICLLVSLIALSGFGVYPICAGRTTLFAQVHLQVLALEGAIVLIAARRPGVLAKVALTLILIIVLAHSAKDFFSTVAAGPAEDLRPAIKLIDPGRSTRLLVPSCSEAQIRSLPDPIPVEVVMLGRNRSRLDATVGSGETCWVVWTHLGAEHCLAELDELRRRARSWQVFDEGRGRGLALAEF
jgi:hypothetical protein